MKKLSEILRVTSNEAERTFIDTLESKVGGNVTVYRRGWPDFLIVKGEKVSAVEVKKDARAQLKPSQARIAAVLERCGITVFVWSPDQPMQFDHWRKRQRVRRTKSKK